MPFMWQQMNSKEDTLRITSLYADCHKKKAYDIWSLLKPVT